MTKKINKENFSNGIDLWVSSAITSKTTGKPVYWASIDQFMDGALLYLSHSVYEGLAEVNAGTVLPVLMTGKFEITEARDIKTGELLYTTGDEEKGVAPVQIYMVSKAREVLHADWA